MTWILATLILWAVPFGAVGSARAETALHEITWAHPTPGQVVRFIVFAAPTSGDQAGARRINVGKPANPEIVGPNSVYSAIISVERTDFVAVGAVALDGSMSPLSDWSTLPPSTPGQPFYIP